MLNWLFSLFLIIWIGHGHVVQTFPFMNAGELEKLVAEQINIDSSVEEPHGVDPIPARSLQRRRAPISPSQMPTSLSDFIDQLDRSSIRPCENDRILDGPLPKRLLNESIQKWINQKNGTDMVKKDGQVALLITLAQLFSKHSYIAASGRSLPPNSSITSHPLVLPDPSDTGPSYAFHLICDRLNQQPNWMPIAVFPTTNPHSFLQLQLPQLPLDACSHSSCPTHCSYTVHGGVRLFARSCCSERERLSISSNGLSHSFSPQLDLCREDWILPQRIFFIVSIVCIIFCLIMIGVVVRERRRQQYDRGWALMEPFFAGAIILYSIPLLGWPKYVPWSCWISIFARQLGFTLFYGSVILKIYRNLQDYRVRKAQHVIVRELDLVVYLLFVLFVVIYGIFAWSSGSWSRPELWTSEWPQCPVEEFANLFSLCEQIVLLYGIRLCYKARNSSWIERYQFTMAIILEAIVSLVVSALRYTLSDIGSRDTLFLIAVIQLHLTISVNIGAIITPKFLVSSESSRRALGNTPGVGNSGRAHPSLAKMRENLINGTIDFQEVPIVDMNPEDIRAELKRVYTQLRMYKLKNAYQDNPHISKRKGGAAKKNQAQTAAANESSKHVGIVSKTGRAGSAAAAVDRRISIPPNIQQQICANSGGFAVGSPMVRREQQTHRDRIAGLDKILLETTEEEKSDLTVESAPYNVHLLTGSGKLGPLNVPMAGDQSIRV